MFNDPHDHDDSTSLLKTLIKADSSTRCNKDEPIVGWLRRSRHHGHSNRQVQVAKCTSTSAQKNDTKFMASSKPKGSSPRSPDHGADAAGPSATNSVVVLVSVAIVPNKPATSRLSEHSEAIMPAVVILTRTCAAKALAKTPPVRA